MEEWKIWHLSQQQITRWSRSKSGSSSYKYNGKQAEPENNKQEDLPWSTSVGRRDCCWSMLGISLLNSPMAALCLAHATTEETLAAGNAIQNRVPI